MRSILFSYYSHVIIRRQPRRKLNQRGVYERHRPSFEVSTEESITRGQAAKGSRRRKPLRGSDGRYKAAGKFIKKV